MSLARQLLFPLTVAAVMALAPAAHAEARHAAMVIDANNGEVLHAQSADEPRFPASLTKMMTLYMAFELIDAGRMSYQSKIKISQEAASAAPSKLDLDPGEDLTALDAIKALVTKSANDIAIAMAEHIGGTEANFARLMTARARQIGMSKTTFRNASGLPDPGQTTTARDMLTLALRLQDDFPRHYGLFATRSFSYNGGTHRNHNTLLGSYAGTDGIKTGYTRASGFNLVSSVRRDGRHVVAAVFGGSSAASRNAQMRALLSRALGRATTQKTRKPQLIAKPKLAPRPQQVAAKPPMPKRVEAQFAEARFADPKIAEASRTPAAAQPAVTAPVSPAAAAAAEEAAAVAPRIDIAKVRRVMVAPRSKPGHAARPADTTEEPSIVAAHRPASHGGYAGAAPPAEAPALPDETILFKASSRRNTSDAPKHMATPPPAAATAATEPSEPMPAAKPVFAAASQVTPSTGRVPPPETGIARTPSTLQQQAMAIGSGAGKPSLRGASAPPSVAPSYRLQGPPRAPTNPAPAATTAVRALPIQGFQIQVGAFATQLEAERQLASIKSRAAGILQGRQSMALPVRKGDRQLFRARFAGFDANGAANTCLELRRLTVDCFVMRPE